MQAALEISFYVLGVVFALGVGMVLLLVRDVFFHGRFNTHLPSVKRVRTTALDAARETLKALQAAGHSARGERRDSIAYEIKHLEHRIEALEDKTYSDQADYYAAAKARERTWREWRALHEESRRVGFRQRRLLRDRLEELRQDYLKLNREVDEEYHRAVARDGLTLEELRSQGVLEPEVLRPPEPAPAAAAAAQGPAGDAPAEAGGPPAAAGAGQAGRWMTPLPPYPPAQGGLLAQADMARPELQKSERTYVEPTFSMAGLPGGMLSGVDMSRSSFAEVEFTGVHRYRGCSFAAADLRRIELRRAESPHMFQDCDLHGASLAQAHLAGVVFRRCNLTLTHWRSARLDRVKFESCDLNGVHWEGVDLSRTVMSEDMLQGADFTFAGKPPLNLRPGLDSPPELLQHATQPGPQPPQPGTQAAPPAGAEPGATVGGTEGGTVGGTEGGSPQPGAAPPAAAPAAPAASPGSTVSSTAGSTAGTPSDRTAAPEAAAAPPANSGAPAAPERQGSEE